MESESRKIDFLTKNTKHSALKRLLQPPKHSEMIAVLFDNWFEII